MSLTPAPVQPPALADAGGLILAPLPYAPLRVLCVDDNEDAADSLGILLRMTGFVAEVCGGAAAALELAGRFRPEAYILDITMPGMDGCELAQALRAADGGAGLFLVAVTAHGDAATVGRTTAAGFDLHLTKPVSPQRLIDVLFEFERRARGQAK
jgi:two-component system OmpR family response regulator